MKTAPKAPERHCVECGAPYAAKKQTALFCSSDCRDMFHRRRKERGAVLYDMVMAMRYERGRSAEKKLYTMLCREAAEFRDIDNRQRNGRKSWRDIDEVIAERPYLTAQAIDRI